MPSCIEDRSCLVYQLQFVSGNYEIIFVSFFYFRNVVKRWDFKMSLSRKFCSNPIVKFAYRASANSVVVASA